MYQSNKQTLVTCIYLKKIDTVSVQLCYKTHVQLHCNDLKVIMGARHVIKSSNDQFRLAVADNLTV